MKRILMLLAVWLLCLPALAETAAVPAQPNPEGWRYLGYTPAGVTMLIPEDTQSYPLTGAEQAAGILFVGANEAYTMQLRRYEPGQMNLTVFSAMMRYAGARVESRESGGTQILSYINTNPTGTSELCGIALTGTDGCMYKISIFTGTDEDFSADAPVWAIARTIAESVSIVDYTGWPMDE